MSAQSARQSGGLTVVGVAAATSAIADASSARHRCIPNAHVYSFFFVCAILSTMVAGDSDLNLASLAYVTQLAQNTRLLATISR